MNAEKGEIVQKKNPVYLYTKNRWFQRPTLSPYPFHIITVYVKKQ